MGAGSGVGLGCSLRLFHSCSLFDGATLRPARRTPPLPGRRAGASLFHSPSPPQPWAVAGCVWGERARSPRESIRDSKCVRRAPTAPSALGCMAGEAVQPCAHAQAQPRIAPRCLHSPFRPAIARSLISPTQPHQTHSLSPFPQASDDRRITKAAWAARCAAVDVRKEDMNRLVMNFLVTEVRVRRVEGRGGKSNPQPHHHHPSIHLFLLSLSLSLSVAL